MSRQGAAVTGVTGPFSLLCALARIRQRGDDHTPGRLFLFGQTRSPLIAQCTRWLGDVFGMTFIGDLGDVEQAYLAVAGASRFRRLIRAPNLLRAWRRAAAARLGSMELGEFDEVSLSFRPMLANVILANLFPRGEIAYVADGLLVGHKTSVQLPPHMRLAMFSDPFRSNHQQEFWAPACLCSALEKYGRPRPIADEHLYQVVSEVCARVELNLWIEQESPLAKGEECSCFLPQYLHPRWISLEAELDFYVSILRRELASSPRRILIKQHPRDDSERVEGVLSLLTSAERKRVFALREGRLAGLPVELLVFSLSIRRLIGVNSTALLTVGALGRLEISQYTRASLPARLRDEIERCAVGGGDGLQEV